MNKTAVVVALLALAGCSSASTTAATSAASGRTSAAAASSAGASTDSAASSAASTKAGGGGNPVNGADFCAVLQKDLPQLKAAGSKTGALVQLTSDLTAFIDAHPTEKPRTAADLDDAVGNSCPNDGAQALGVLGKSSFAQALGG